MNLFSLKKVKELLLKNGVRPSKIMGQNFLVDQKVMAKITESAELTPNDIVLEVGPGIGTLTQELAKKVKKVIAVEKDRNMSPILQETLADYTNIEIINQDIRFLNPQSHILNSHYKVVANIPYYLTSLLIRKFLEEESQPSMMVLMIQKEVAQRICSKPPNMSLLSVSVQFYAEPKIVSYVKKESFWPSPKVDSAIIKITPLNGKKTVDVNLFFKVVRAGFSQPRKQLANNLSKSLKMNKEQVNKWLIINNVSPEQRAETLSIKDWENLTGTLSDIE